MMLTTHEYEPNDEVSRIANKYMTANIFQSAARNPKRFTTRMALMQKELIMRHLHRMSGETKARAIRTLDYLTSSLTKE